ncbi:MAG: hypothetical protein EXX96DRAFT_544855 [Benjaminiella poitrasii]|nr:MAG: hypothetical protein EXX96DRAFT_544855 [Benjaminiella poitrasii]
MESLYMLWNDEEKIHLSLDKEVEETKEHYWAKEINTKDVYKKSKARHDFAKELGLPSSAFPIHTPVVKKENNISEGGLPRVNRTAEKVDTGSLSNRVGIAFPPDDLKNMKRPPRPHIPKCDINKLNHQKTKVMTIFPHQMETTNIKLDGLFSDGGKVTLRTATAAEEVANEDLKTNIQLNFTLYAQSDDLLTHVLISEIDNNNSRTKNVHINNHHPSALNACLVYNLDIIFPSKLNSYKNLNIKVNHAGRIQGDLKSIVFKKISVGLGRGAIKFKDLKADNILLGTLNGIILGNYLPIQSIGAASINGATNIQITPQSEHVKSTVVGLDGPVKASILTSSHGITKNSAFTVHCWMCTPTVMSNDASNKDVHITSARRKTIKMGYYKELCSAHVNVHSRYGESKLVYA